MPSGHTQTHPTPCVTTLLAPTVAPTPNGAYVTPTSPAHRSALHLITATLFNHGYGVFEHWARDRRGSFGLRRSPSPRSWVRAT